MAATYWVLASDELMAMPDLAWPDGFRHVEAGPYQHPGMRWHKFHDDDAPDELEGKLIEPLFARSDDGKVTITARRPAL